MRQAIIPKAIGTIQSNILRQKCGHTQIPQSNNIHRMSSNYSMGFGWTGALGTGSLATHQEQEIPLLASNSNNNDEFDESEESINVESDCIVGEDVHFEQSGLIEILHDQTVIAASCGWGHSAVITSNNKSNENNTLLCAGRPHDFQALLRLQRLPTFITDLSVKIAYYFDARSEGNTDLSESNFEQNPTVPSFDSGTNSNAILPNFISIPLPNNEVPIHVEASAGLTLVLSQSGTIYSFGLNQHGQAGIGITSNNVWVPTPVTIQNQAISENNLPFQFAIPVEKNRYGSRGNKTMALGLQHALAIDPNGLLYSWGKGSRGQLGHGIIGSCDSAKIVTAFHTTASKYTPVTHVAAGFNHSACITADNKAWIWGKNVTFQNQVSSLDDISKDNVTDCSIPIEINGLPSGLQLMDITCGSHHTSILMEDGSVYSIGIATDNNTPLLNEAVMIISPNSEFSNGNIRQFSSGFDRTTLISKNGAIVKEIQLWSDEQLREDAAMIPASVAYLKDESKFLNSMDEKRLVPEAFILSRGWQHSMLIMK